mgnify:CR=1 FL=1
MKIYTKTGDSGETSLFDNTRVSKADARVDAYGEVDEVNACLGAARAAGVDEDIAALIESLQKDLFALGARLADPSARIAPRVEKAAIGEAAYERLEQAIDRLEETLPPLRQVYSSWRIDVRCPSAPRADRLPPRRAARDCAWCRCRRSSSRRLSESIVRPPVRHGSRGESSLRVSGD